MKFSEETLNKAHTLLDRGQVEQDEDHPAVWWITSLTNPDSRYRVQSDWNAEKRTLTWVTCTCPHGLNSGAGDTRCYHVAAVLLALRKEVETGG